MIRTLPYSDSGFDLRNNHLESGCGTSAGVFQVVVGSVVSLVQLEISAEL